MIALPEILIVVFFAVLFLVCRVLWRMGSRRQ